MKKITFKTHYFELKALAQCLDHIPPSGTDVGAKMAASILVELRPKLQMKLYSWEGSNKSHTITWSNHVAMAASLYASRIIGASLIHNDHDRSCLDMLRLKLQQKLA